MVAVFPVSENARTSLFSVIIACSVTFILFVVPVQAAGHNVLLIGNSLVIHGGPCWDLEGAAKASGYPDYYQLVNWYPGSDMMQVWQDKSLMEDQQFHYNSEEVGFSTTFAKGKVWDYVLLEPYSPGWKTYNPKSDSIYANLMYDSVLTLSTSNANCVCVIYQHWPLRGTTYATTDASRKVSQFEFVARGVQNRHPGKKVVIAPAGMVIDSLCRLANSGKLPGVTSDSVFFDPGDTQHPSLLGGWAVMLTWYATIFQKDPAALANTCYTGAAVPTALATIIKNVVWGIVSSYSWTKVGATSVGQPVSPVSQMSVCKFQKGNGLIDIRGRDVSGNLKRSGTAIVINGAQLVQMQLMPGSGNR
jgi:hypothetical protein